MSRSRSQSDPAQVLAFAVECARTTADMKCTDVTLLDVRGLSEMCDYLVIASGTSERQMRSVAQAVEDVGKEQGSPPFRSSRDSGTTWIVVDFVETVVHLFEPDQRFYYDLESMWREAKRVEWRRPDDPSSATGSSASASEDDPAAE